MQGKRRVLLIGIIVMFLSLMLGTAGTIYTARPRFCASCHEVDGYYLSWTYSSHKPVHCLSCHAGDTGTFAFWKTHFLKGIPHSINHILGTYKTPLEAKTIKNVICLQCHQGMHLVSEIGKIRMEHGFHLERDLLCTDCHAGVVHTATSENRSPRPPMARCLACHKKRGGPMAKCTACHLKPP
jgi:hypothetical protein